MASTSSYCSRQHRRSIGKTSDASREEKWQSWTRSMKMEAIEADGSQFHAQNTTYKALIVFSFRNLNPVIEIRWAFYTVQF
jgi:hypothetical protein